MDFVRGPAEMAPGLAEGRPCRISAAFTLRQRDGTGHLLRRTRSGVVPHYHQLSPFEAATVGLSSAVGWGIWGAGAIAHNVASDFPMMTGARLQAVASCALPHAT